MTSVASRKKVTTPGLFHILIIESEPTQTEIYSDLIREVVDCKVDVMSRADASLDWLIRSNYQLIVVDRDGPEGFHLLEQIKRVSPVTSVLVISAQATVEEAVAAIRLGAEDYLKKPFNPEVFQLAVKRGLDRKAVFGTSEGASSFMQLIHSCQMISASLEESKIFEIVQSYFARELRSPHSAVYSLHGDVMMRIEGLEGDQSQERAMQEVLDIALHDSNPLLKMSENDEAYRFIERGRLTPALFVLRFRCAGPAEYFCVNLSPKKPNALEAFENRIRMLKAQIELAGKNIEQYMGIQQLAYVDDATGLYNTRYLHYILDREISQAKQADKSFAVLFIDVDHFKGINDTHGHLAGTKILLELGLQLKKLVREADTVFRYGGDEFIAVLFPCDLATAKAVAERIRRSIEKTPFLESEGLSLKFTVSIGVAIFPDHAGSKQEIIDAADQAMYDAKRSTRNSVTIASGPSAPPKKGAVSGERS